MSTLHLFSAAYKIEVFYLQIFTFRSTFAKNARNRASIMRKMLILKPVKNVTNQNSTLNIQSTVKKNVTLYWSVFRNDRISLSFILTHLRMLLLLYRMRRPPLQVPQKLLILGLLEIF